MSKQVKKNILRFLLGAILLFGVTLSIVRWHVWFHYYHEEPYTTTSFPSRIVLSYGENTTSDRTITWLQGQTVHASTKVKLWTILPDTALFHSLQVQAAGRLINRKKTGVPFEAFQAILAETSAKQGQTFSPSHQLVITDGGKSLYYHAQLKDLKPGYYAYRIESNQGNSPYLFFAVRPKDHHTKFMYIGDIQQHHRDYVDSTFYEAMKYLSREVDAVLYAGDLIERPLNKYWNTLFSATGGLMAQIPTVVVSGNHEIQKNWSRSLDKRWDVQFPDPKHGLYSGPYYAYGLNVDDITFMGLDTEHLRSPWAFLKTCLWMNKVLKATKGQWHYTMMHHPVYSVRPSRLNIGERYWLGTFFNRHKFDLILQGHDHGYGRRFAHDPQANNLIPSLTPTKYKPMYVVSFASEKSYEVDPNAAMEKLGNRIRSVQTIEQKGDTLWYKSYTSDLILFDQAVLLK